eukprot:scaffold4663_cov104-Isochrysis_galbana.AAC.7
MRRLAGSPSKFASVVPIARRRPDVLRKMQRQKCAAKSRLCRWLSLPLLFAVCCCCAARPGLSCGALASRVRVCETVYGVRRKHKGTIQYIARQGHSDTARAPVDAGKGEGGSSVGVGVGGTPL